MTLSMVTQNLHAAWDDHGDDGLSTSRTLMFSNFIELNLIKSWNLGPLSYSLLLIFLPLTTLVEPPQVLGPWRWTACGAHESGANKEVWCVKWNISIHAISSSVYSSISTPLGITSWVFLPLCASDPCLVLVIKWQSRWTNMCLYEIHRKLVHRYTCVEGAYCIYDMTWSHVTRWRRSRQGLALLMDKGNGEEQASLRSMNQRGHIMIWNWSYHLVGNMVGACVASTLEEMEWNVQDKGIFVGHSFYRSKVE
jgi:hypothetical protein